MMDLLYSLLLLLLMVQTDAGSFSNNPGKVQVPYVHDADLLIWDNIVATYLVPRNCTEPSCNYNLGALDCRQVTKSCPQSALYDRCDLSYYPQNIFYIEGLTIKKRACFDSECRYTCPGSGSSCLYPGATVSVGVICWSSTDRSAGSVSTSLNVTSDLGSSALNCPLLTVSNGILSSADTRHCNTVKISCIPDYNLIGESDLTCCNGNWSSTAPTCRKGCSSFSVSNGNVLTKETENGPVATVICHDGYSLTEAPTLSCNDGNWNKVPPLCYADCKSLTIPNGEVTDTGNSHGTRTNITCNAGYSLSGSPTLTCSYGSWTDVFPTCGKDCPALSVSNGNVSPRTLIHGSRVNIACDSGYSLVGPSVMACTDGSWNTNQPFCLRDCERNTFGINCTVCDCIANNTVDPEQSCDKDSGKCQCLPGWEGKSCDADVDECQQELHNCDVEISVCQNIPGNFMCHTRTPAAVIDDARDFVLPLALGLVIFFLLMLALASLLTWMRMKRKRERKSDEEVISYVDLDVLQYKDERCRNNSHASDDSGYCEKSWNNPFYTQSPESRFEAPEPTPCPAGPGEEVDWDYEDLTYL